MAKFNFEVLAVMDVEVEAADEEAAMEFELELQTKIKEIKGGAFKVTFAEVRDVS